MNIRRIKRTIIVLLSMIMIIGTATVAMAASTKTEGATEKTLASDTDTAEVNITTSNVGDQLYIFKVVDVTYDAVGNELSYEFTDFYEEFFSKHNTVKSTEDYLALETGADFDKLYGELSAYTVTKENWTSSATKNATTLASGKLGVAKVTLDLGQYIVISGGNNNMAKVYNPVSIEVVPHVSNGAYKIYSSYDVVMKTTAATVSVEIAGTTADGDRATISEGDTITYNLEATVPTYPAGARNTTYFITATFDGITVDESSITVKGSGNAALVDDDTAYTVTVDEETGTMYIDFEYDQISSYTSLDITYEAFLNEDAAVGPDKGNTNSVTLTYSNAPYIGTTYDPKSEDTRPDSDDGGYYVTELDTETVYTYKIYVDKYDDKDVDTKLAGAVFEIYKNADCSGGSLGTIQTNADGMGLSKGLAAGTYYLKETKAPAGYNLLKDLVEVEVSATESKYVVSSIKAVKVEIANSTGATLPSTGGFGEVLLYCVGGSLICLALVFMVIKKCRKSKTSS